jgi:hypothetical protein
MSLIPRLMSSRYMMITENDKISKNNRIKNTKKLKKQYIYAKIEREV